MSSAKLWMGARDIGEVHAVSEWQVAASGYSSV
jgi:hypothetical protein